MNLIVLPAGLEPTTRRLKAACSTIRAMKAFHCTPNRTRTYDPLIKSQLLYQLSYEGMMWTSVVTLHILQFFRLALLLS